MDCIRIVYSYVSSHAYVYIYTSRGRAEHGARSRPERIERLLALCLDFALSYTNLYRSLFSTARRANRARRSADRSVVHMPSVAVRNKVSKDLANAARTVYIYIQLQSTVWLWVM